MPTPFLLILVAPDGGFSASFSLEPGQIYGPDDVQVEQGRCCTPHGHTLTVNVSRLPSEVDFWELAARAATRAATAPQDSLGYLLHLLMPF